MPRQTEQLELEAEQARAELTLSLEELRSRMTPGAIIDEIVDYASDTPVGEFARNLARDVRASPLPLLVIFAGIAWAAIASAMAQRKATARRWEERSRPLAEPRPAEMVVTEWEVAPVSAPVE